MSATLKAIFTLDELVVTASIKDKFKITVDDCGDVISIPFTIEEKFATTPDNGNDGVLIRTGLRDFTVPEGQFVADKKRLHIDGTYERDFNEDTATGKVTTGFDVPDGAIVSLNYNVLV